MSHKTIYVTGHKHPDSDSIISAMAYAYLKQQLGYDAIAVRIGETNKETEYILKRFDEFAPPLVSDIRTCLRDIDFDDVITCRPDTNIGRALVMMNNKKKKVIAVTDDNDDLIGMATISDITSHIVGEPDKRATLLAATPLGALAEVLKGQVVFKAEGPNSNGRLMVAGMGQPLSCQNMIVVTGDDKESQLAAISGQARMIIACCAKDFDMDVIDSARQKGCTLLISPMTIYEVTRYVDLAAPISLVMSTQLTLFKLDDQVDDVKIRINNSRYRSYPVMDSRNHIVGTISRFHLFKHTNRNLIMVDHNELDQSIDGAEEANIMEIIDHHRLGGTRSAAPVYFRNEQVGCCATIITEMYKEKKVEIPVDLAGMLCCAIISDTVAFRSVTCTDTDRQIAKELAQIANLDLEALGNEILAASATISQKSAREIVINDIKRFEIEKFKVAIGQINVVDFRSIAPRHQEVDAYLKEYADQFGLDCCIMAFTLVDGSGTYLLAQGPDCRPVGYGFDKVGVMKDGFIFLPKVMSRKMQILPLLTEGVMTMYGG